MVQPKILANAITTISAIGYIICWLLSLIIPDMLFGVFQSWIHGLNLSAVKATSPEGIGATFIGLITWSVLVWVWVYASAALYNKWAK